MPLNTLTHPSRAQYPQSCTPHLSYTPRALIHPTAYMQPSRLPQPSCNTHLSRTPPVTASRSSPVTASRADERHRLETRSSLPRVLTPLSVGSRSPWSRYSASQESSGAIGLPVERLRFPGESLWLALTGKRLGPGPGVGPGATGTRLVGRLLSLSKTGARQR